MAEAQGGKPWLGGSCLRAMAQAQDRLHCACSAFGQRAALRAVSRHAIRLAVRGGGQSGKTMGVFSLIRSVLCLPVPWWSPLIRQGQYRRAFRDWERRKQWDGSGRNSLLAPALSRDTQPCSSPVQANWAGFRCWRGSAPSPSAHAGIAINAWRIDGGGREGDGSISSRLSIRWANRCAPLWAVVIRASSSLPRLGPGRKPNALMGVILLGIRPRFGPVLRPGSRVGNVAR